MVSINILVCDDEKKICDSVVEYIKNNFNHNVNASYSKEEVMDMFSKDIYNLLIIDIQLNDDNGIEVAKELHKINPMLKVVFITGFGDVYYKDIFGELSPQGFIEKPIQYNILNFFIKQVEKEFSSNEMKIKITFDSVDYLISVDKILYLQGDKRVCEIVTKNKTYKCYQKLNHFQKQLPETFIRTHHSFLVNSKYIKALKPKCFVLINDEIIPISESHLKESRIKYYSNI